MKGRERTGGGGGRRPTGRIGAVVRRASVPLLYLTLLVLLHATACRCDGKSIHIADGTSVERRQQQRRQHKNDKQTRPQNNSNGNHGNNDDSQQRQRVRKEIKTGRNRPNAISRQRETATEGHFVRIRRRPQRKGRPQPQPKQQRTAKQQPKQRRRFSPRMVDGAGDGGDRDGDDLADARVLAAISRSVQDPEEATDGVEDEDEDEDDGEIDTAFLEENNLVDAKKRRVLTGHAGGGNDDEADGDGEKHGDLGNVFEVGQTDEEIEKELDEIMSGTSNTNERSDGEEADVVAALQIEFNPNGSNKKKKQSRTTRYKGTAAEERCFRKCLDTNRSTLDKCEELYPTDKLRKRRVFCKIQSLLARFRCKDDCYGTSACKRQCQQNKKPCIQKCSAINNKNPINVGNCRRRCHKKYKDFQANCYERCDAREDPPETDPPKTETDPPEIETDPPEIETDAPSVI